MSESKNERFIRRVKEQVGDEYTFLEEYKYAREKLTVIHNVCGHKYSVRPDNFLGKNQRRCPKCSMKKKPQCNPYTQEEFTNIMYSLVGEEYTVLGEYKGFRIPILIRHEECGNEYETTYENFNRGRRCNRCAVNLRRKPLKVFEKEVYKLGGGEYELVGKYVNNNTLTEFKHIKCGHIFPSLPSNFLAGNRCPKCRVSKGENRIANYLKDNGYDYDTQVTLKGLVDIHPLRFDFSVKSDKSTKKVLIEYDGEQHFIPVKHWGGEEGLNNNKRRDRLKNEYCKNNGYKLIRIPYWEFDNIEKILDEKLKGDR